MAAANIKSYYDVLGLPRDCQAPDIRRDFLKFANKDLSDLSIEKLRAKYLEIEQVVTAYKILTNKHTRKAYDKTLPSLDIHTTDGSTSIKDWAPGPETPIPKARKRATRERSEATIRSTETEVPLSEMKKLVMALQCGENTLRDWRDIEVERLRATVPSYLGILPKTILKGLKKLGINKEGIEAELQDRERYSILTECYKWLLRTVEIDLNLMCENPGFAF